MSVLCSFFTWLCSSKRRPAARQTHLPHSLWPVWASLPFLLHLVHAWSRAPSILPFLSHPIICFSFVTVSFIIPVVAVYECYCFNREVHANFSLRGETGNLTATAWFQVADGWEKGEFQEIPAFLKSFPGSSKSLLPLKSQNEFCVWSLCYFIVLSSHFDPYLCPSHSCNQMNRDL